MKGCTFLISVCTLLLLGLQSSTAQYGGQEQQQDRCPQHEQQVDCVNNCHNCLFVNKKCPIPKDECVSGCDCKTGFLRNKFGYCIPKRFCGASELPAPNTEEEPTEDGEEEELENRGGCPDPAKCNSTCRTQGFTHGSCLGSQRSNCTCRVSRPPVREVAQSGGCPSDRICTLSCNRRGFKTGLCLGPGRDSCNCYTAVQIKEEGGSPGNQEVAESGGCPNARICTLSCERRGFKSGLCLGPGLESCNCYTTLRVPAEGGTSGDREVADSGGCPSTLRCMQSCNRRNFETGVCLGPRRGFCNCYSSSSLRTHGCPQESLCVTSCKRRGYITGYCSGPRRLNCNCSGRID